MLDKYLFDKRAPISSIQLGRDVPGRVNFRNLGRYTSMNEKTFSRWFRRPFDFVTFNLLSLKGLSDNGEWVAAMDASFLPKSGRTSYGLDWFWNGSQGKAERGLEPHCWP